MKVERILVAIDDSPGSLAAAEAAAEIAAWLHAELEGLFVEDDRLLRFAASPLARQVDELTGGRGRPEAATVTRQLRLQGRRARACLQRIAERRGIRWSFRTARGSVSSEIAAAAAAAQIVSLGTGGWSTRPQQALGAAASAVLEKRSASTLLLRRRLDIKAPILVVYDGSSEAEKALSLGRQLAGEDAPGPQLLLVGADEVALRHAVADHRDVSIVGYLPSPREPGLRRLLQRAHAGLIVFPVDGGIASRDVLHEILADVESPVLLVS